MYSQQHERSNSNRPPAPRPVLESSPSDHISLGPSAPGATESLDQYEDHELPTTVLQTCILPPSDLRANAMFSDLTGRFPATAIDGSQYLLLSVYKKYIHIELLPSRSESSIIDAYSRTYQWFSQYGHFVQFQVMDNEAPKGLRQHFIASNITYEFVPPLQKDLTRRSGRYKPSSATSSQSWPALTHRFPSISGTSSSRRQRSP
jgi:hypothetical protein